MSGLNTLILHVAVITPVCQYILTSGKFPKPRNFLFAAAFLAAVALGGEFMEWQQRPPNYYRILEVDRTTTPAELKRAYRDATLRYHPDKNKSPDAPALFQAATEAYETLSDKELRHLYERYGAEAVKDVRARAVHSSRSDSQLLFGMASFYVVWSVLTYLMTLGKARAQGRTWSFVGLIIAAFMEFQMTFAGWDPLSSVLTRTTIQEKVALVHSLYPAFMHSCNLLSQFTFVDLDAIQLIILQTVMQQQKELGEMLKHVVQCVDKKHGASVAASGGASINSTGEAMSEENLSVAQRMKRQEAGAAKALQDAQQKQGKGGIPSWVIMIGMYVLFNFLLK